MSGTAFDSFTTENGAQVEITDLSQPYAYANIFHVKLKVEARYQCGGAIETFTRTLEKMGVYAEELDRTRNELTEEFKKNVLPYLCRGDFAEKLKIAREKETAPATGYGK